MADLLILSIKHPTKKLFSFFACNISLHHHLNILLSSKIISIVVIILKENLY